MKEAAHSKRAAKVQEARESLDESVRLLAEQMSRGKSEALVRYLEFSARFHHYSFGNILLIHMQFPSASRVAGLRQWNTLGRYVRQGEKGIMILAPMQVWAKSKERGEELDYIEETPKAKEDADRQKITIFKPVYVFDVSQTEGEELPELLHASGDVTACLPALEKSIKQSGFMLEFVDWIPQSPSAQGVSFGGRIVIRTDLDPPERFRTLVHEFAHELLHWPDDRSEKPDKMIRETEADATAFVVCRHFGIHCDTADYLLLYDADSKILLNRLETIRQTSTQIIDSIDAVRDNLSAEVMN